jgi:membrane protease YdiL (CAAX protease family)
LKPSEIESSGFLIAWATIVSAPVAVGLSWLFASLRRGLAPAAYLGLVKPRARWYLISLGGLILLIVGMDLLTTALNRPVVPQVMIDAYKTAGSIPLFWLGLVVGAPVAEEFMFRGFVFEGLRRSRLGGLGATLITSLVWAGIHLQYDLYGIGIIFAVGLFLGWVKCRTGSLWLVIFLHSLMNLVATAQIAFLLRESARQTAFLH